MIFNTLLTIVTFGTFANAFKFMEFCPGVGMIRSSHRHRLHWNPLPHFRKLRLLLKPENPDVFSNGVHDAENVFHLIKSLPRDCFTYDDEHYTYEYCHMESARQMGRTVTNNLREEYNLGRFSPQQSIQKYSPLLRLAKISLVGGDACEGGRERKTKVKFFCTDPKLSMHIVSAREKSLCNYRILVHVPELCFK